MKYAIVTDEAHKHAASTVQLLQECRDKSLAFVFNEDLSSDTFWVNNTQYEDVTEYADDIDLVVGDRIFHCKDSDLFGEVIYIDFNMIADGYSSTTCLVLWDGGDIGDVQWTNKLIPEDVNLLVA